MAHAHFNFISGYEGGIERQAALLAAEGFQGYFSVEIMPKEGESGEEFVAQHAARWRALREQVGG